MSKPGLFTLFSPFTAVAMLNRKGSNESFRALTLGRGGERTNVVLDLEGDGVTARRGTTRRTATDCGERESALLRNTRGDIVGVEAVEVRSTGRRGEDGGVLNGSIPPRIGVAFERTTRTPESRKNFCNEFGGFIY